MHFFLLRSLLLYTFILTDMSQPHTLNLIVSLLPKIPTQNNAMKQVNYNLMEFSFSSGLHAVIAQCFTSISSLCQPCIGLICDILSFCSIVAHIYWVLSDACLNCHLIKMPLNLGWLDNCKTPIVSICPPCADLICDMQLKDFFFFFFPFSFILLLSISRSITRWYQVIFCFD